MSTTFSLPTSAISNTNRSTNISNENNNEEDQLNRINLQALQNRDPYIVKIIDQAQRVCVYKFIGEKREWERKDLEGTLFVYERTCEPYHGFVILSTVSRETFVQIIKSSMEFKHSPNYEAFLQYKVDVGDIYGIWFISKNDCPRVTECLKRLTIQAKEHDQSKDQSMNNFNNNNLLSTLNQGASDIFSLLVNAQEKFQESKRKQEGNNSESVPPMPAALLRLFSTQDTATLPTNNDEREQELKKTLKILGKPALSVTELEKQLLQPPPVEMMKPITTSLMNHNNNNIIEDLAKNLLPIETKKSIPMASHSLSSCVINDSTNDWTLSAQNLFNGFDPFSTNASRLMAPADFETLQITQSPVFIPPPQNDPISSCHHCQSSSMNHFSKDTLRHLLIDMLKNDEEFLTGLHNAYTERQNDLHRMYS